MKSNFKIQFHSQLNFVNRMEEISCIYTQSITIPYLSCLRALFCDFNNNMAKSFLFPKNTIPENAYHISSTQRYFPMRIWTKGFQRHFVQLHCICSLAFLPVQAYTINQTIYALSTRHLFNIEISPFQNNGNIISN